MVLDDKKLGQEKKILELKIEQAKQNLYGLMGMLDALTQVEKLAPEPEEEKK